MSNIRDTHEIWKNIRESKNRYSISNLGRVRNNITGNIIKPVMFRKGYTKVNLKLGNGKEINRQVHRLVAIEFIPNPENKPEVNHKNGIHDDNRVENLEWVTGEENRRHAYETGLQVHKDERNSGYLYRFWVKHHRKNEWTPEWQEYLVFYEWCKNNGYIKGLRLCRKDINNTYNPDNCYFNQYIQAKRKRKLYIYNGKKYNLDELAEISGLTKQTVTYRLNKGMTVEDAVTKQRWPQGKRKAMA